MMWKSVCSSSSSSVRQLVTSQSKRCLEISAIERAVGQYAANQFLESMQLSSQHIVSVFSTPVVNCADSSFLASLRLHH